MRAAVDFLPASAAQKPPRMNKRICCITLLAACHCVFLPSCQQQQKQLQFLFHETLSVPEHTPVELSAGGVVFHLQLLPNKGGVRVESSYHPLFRGECLAAGIPCGTFVLKDNAYGVEQKLRAIMKMGYNKYDVEHGDDDTAGEQPYIGYCFHGYYRVCRSEKRFGGDSMHNGPLCELDAACREANRHELHAPRPRPQR